MPTPTSLALDFGQSIPKPVHTYLLATAPLGADLESSLGIEQRTMVDIGGEYFYARLYQNRLLFGGFDQSGSSTVELTDRAGSLLRRLRAAMTRRYPLLADVAIDALWGGPYHETRTQVPVIRPLRGMPDVILNIGYGGVGLTMTQFSGRLVAGLVLGEKPSRSGLRSNARDLCVHAPTHQRGPKNGVAPPPPAIQVKLTRKRENTKDLETTLSRLIPGFRITLICRLGGVKMAFFVNHPALPGRNGSSKSTRHATESCRSHLAPITVRYLLQGLTVNRLISRTVPWIFLLCMACGQPPGGSGGFRIAYVPSISGQSGIFVMNSDTTGSRLLVSDKNAQLRFASWSPDGKKIAFFTVRAQDADILKKYLMPYKYLLYVMDSSGNNVKRLLDFPIFDFAWAPNGRQLFVISAHESPDRDSPEVIGRNQESLCFHLYS